MAAIKPEDVGDMVITTLRNLKRMQFQQIAQSLQEYEVMGRWLKSDRVSLDSGRGINRTLMDKTIGAAEFVTPYEKEEANFGDHLVDLVTEWCHVQTHWIVVYQETLMNRGAALINKIIKPRRAGALIDLADILEEKAWSTVRGVNDNNYPDGMTYWVVKNASEGFNGGLPGSHTTIGGINLTNHPNFKNYTNTYTNWSKQDGVKKLKRAHRKCRWKSPVTIKDFRGGAFDRYRVYCNNDTIEEFEDLGEAQNENLGRDVASKGTSRDIKFVDETITFRRHPVVWVPQLDAESDDPVYLTDHSTFETVVLKGDYLRENKPIRANDQHNMWKVFVDLSYQHICVDRRRQAVLYKA